MAIKHRIHSSPASLDEMIDDSRGKNRSPLAEKRALWVKEHITTGLEKQFGMKFDRVLSNDSNICYLLPGGTDEDAQAMTDWLTKSMGVKFNAARTGAIITFANVSTRVSRDGQYVYFTVSRSSSRGASVTVHF